MTSLIFAESALEIVPDNLQRHRSITTYARRLGKHPSEILLDNSWHHAAMRGLENEIKRGRPDIIHQSLLASTCIPLYHEHRIQVYIHTVADKVIRVGRGVNLPKSYHRFQGVFEKLFRDASISDESRMLLDVQDMKLAKLVEEIGPSRTVGLTREGAGSSCHDVAGMLDDDACLIIGGFQKGHFAESTKKSIDEMYGVDEASLESHVVASRVLYEYEKTIFM